MNFFYSKKPIYKGDAVKIARTCPYYVTFPEKLGWLRQVSKDSIGYLFLVETQDGEKVYLRQSEFTVLNDRKAG